MLAATAVSSVGNGLSFVALPLLAIRVTSNPGLVAGVAVASRLPWLLVGLAAGALADRLPRARTLAAVEGGRAALVVAMALAAATGHSPILLLFVVAFALGSLETLFFGLIQGGLPELVADHQLEAANGRLATVEASGQFLVGPALGGLLFVAARALPFAVDAASFAVSGILLAAAFAGLARPVAASAGRLRDDIAVGLRYFAKTPIIRVLTAVLAAFALFQALATATLVLYALHRLHIGVAGYGLFVTVTAVGDVGGGLLAARVSARLPTRVLLVSAGVGTGVCYLALGLVPVIGVALPALMFEGIAVTMGVVASMALRQRIIPRDLLGRVGNTVRVVVYGSVPLGALLGGFVASRFGLAAPFVVAGTGQVLVLAVLARPLLRDERRPAMAPGGLAGVRA